MTRVKKYLGIVGTSAIFGLVLNESINCVQRIRKPLNLRVLDKRSDCYIYIKRDYFREPVKDIFLEIFQEETLLYNLLYNIKKKLTFTKVNWMLI